MKYTEDALVEQPAIQLFAELEWETLTCWEEAFGPESDLGRNTRGDVVLFNRLRAVLERLNPAAPELALDEAIEALSRDRSAMSMIAANEQIYLLLREGYRYQSGEEGEEDLTVRIIDWSAPANNDFLLCSQMTITGEIETRRPDLIGFVNGLPLLFVELKASHRQLIHAYRDNLADYRTTIPHLFWFNQLILLSNGVQSKLGTISSSWEHFAEWKKIESEKEPRKVSLEVAIRGMCEQGRFLDLIENYSLFVRNKETVRIVARYHQYLGVNEALRGLESVQQREGQLGVFWHTQGSGKSFSMTFFTRKAFRKLPGNWTFVVVTDRTDLDDQIYKTFHSAGLLLEESQAESGDELKRMLSEDRRFVFTLIQKFRAEPGEPYPELSQRDDVIVITDEAHRSQYDTLAMNMRRALPNAAFIAFTGTPLLSGEEKTREVFGDYVSIYNFADAVDDGATLPLYYENRVPEVNLNRDDLGEEITALLDEADLSDEQEAKLEQEFGRAYHIITREERLETIANDIVDHYLGREPFSGGESGNVWGKAMVVSIDKATAIRMYDKVQIAWQQKLRRLQQRLKVAGGSHRARLQQQIALLESTDMAVVVSGGQNDYERMEKLGLDYKRHRERMVKEELDEDFKDAEHPLRIVFVCAMWLTGFDAPSVSTLYLDKPLKEHTLMQTIARANRVFPGKAAGQVVDYINIFGALQQALGMYGGGVAEEGVQYEIDTPANDKQVLLDELEQAMGAVRGFLAEQQISLQAVMEASDDLQRLTLLDAASEALLDPKYRDEFISYLRQINRIFKAILPDSRADGFVRERVALNIIYRQMRVKSGLEVDDSDVLDVVRHQVGELLDEAIETIHIGSNLPEPVDISAIDFEALAEMVAKQNRPGRSDVERLKVIIARKLVPMVERNSSRQDLQDRFQQLIEQYNLGAYSAEQFFEELKQFIGELEQEEQRTLREGLSEEELAIFDLLCSEVTLSEKERNEIKRIAHDLLEKLRALLVIDWRKKQRTKARVDSLIKDMLDELPEQYDDALWSRTCERVYLHVYDKYAGEGVSVYG
ncbi:MAG: type I restriction endonuclease subunit R [Thiotrichales bacterium]|nr:type I restriction endonuclease subunit R [Gammaproteobacteria bacterium]MBT4606152.1 type I restriction endonuclease subunit R [Thiotrichales bacterium]MBT6080354.1 type I restriction endonuclease subunit R [Gammaproteobacteria bacterium]MBT6669770.1 type I restriction endonuclease subunit R [Gammaproteobacteria bacterium]